VAHFRTELKRQSLNDKSRALKHIDSGCIAIPVRHSFVKEVDVEPTSVTTDAVTSSVRYGLSSESHDNITCQMLADSDCLYYFRAMPFTFQLLASTPRKSASQCKKTQRLVDGMKEFLRERAVPWTDDLVNDLPTRWEIHGDLLMLSADDCFTHDIWKEFGALNV